MTPKTWTVRRTTELPANPDGVWARATTMEGVNDELGPWIGMSVPVEVRDKTLEDVPLGELAFHSWLLLFGFLPFDRHALRVDEIGERRFLERSSSWMQALWQHERFVEPSDAGCTVTDVVTFRPRIAALGGAVRPIVSAIFRHRHRQLQATWGISAQQQEAR